MPEATQKQTTEEHTWTTGKVTVKIPKDTLAVITAKTNAQYAQSVTVSGGGLKAMAFNGRGLKNRPMALKDGMEYLTIEPANAERDLGFSFSYETELDSGAWEAPKVEEHKPEVNRGISMVYIGTEDSTDNSFADTALTVCLFPKKA